MDKANKTPSATVGDIEAQNGLPADYFYSSLFLGSLTAIGMGLFAAIAGFAFAAPMLTLINQEIGPSPDITWVSLTYTLTIAVGLTLIGRMTDTFGRRYIFIGGGVLGTVGSIICSRAQSVNTLIAGMTLIGLAASTQVSYFYVMAELVPMKYRFAGNGLMYVFTTPGGAFAPAIADAFVRNTASGWRGCFYVLIAINAFALLCFVLFYWPPSFRDKHAYESKKKYIIEFDYVGVVLFAGGLLVFMMGLSWGGSRYRWDSAYVVASMVVGGAAFFAFIVWECYGAVKEPLVPMHHLHNIPWAAAVVTSGLGASLYYGLAVVWPSMVAVVYATDDPVSDSLVSSLVGAGWLFGEIASGFAAGVLRRIKLQSIATLAIAGILLACVATCTVDSRDRACWLVAFGTFFAGWVEGLSLTITTLALEEQDQLGTACGFGGSIRFSITTVVTVIYNVILSTRLAHTVPARLMASVETAGLSTTTVAELIGALKAGKLAQTVEGVSPAVAMVAQRAYQEANIDAYRTIFLSTIAVTALGLGSALLLPDADKLMSNAVTASLRFRTEIKEEPTEAEQAN